jgi:hypothetical protein
MLAMKENIGISRDFADRMLRRFHGKQTSRGRAGGTKVPNPQNPNPGKASNDQISKTPLHWGLEFGAWDFEMLRRLGATNCSILSSSVTRCL